MTTHLVTFSDESMSRARELCVSSALVCGIDQVWPWCKEAIEHWGIAERHSRVFRQPDDARRAWAWWAWKPLIINRHLRELFDGEIVVYADAGVEFINNVSHIIDRMGHVKPQDDIWIFGNNWEHAHWCKRDVIEVVWPLFRSAEPAKPENLFEDSFTWSRFRKQVQASVIFFRVSDYTRAFVKEWLDRCLFEGGRLIDDSPSRLPNHPEFQEHRHDQAILTTMAYREGIKLHYWPAQYNDGAFNYEKLPCYAGDDYPILFHHHRRRNHEWENAA